VNKSKKISNKKGKKNPPNEDFIIRDIIDDNNRNKETNPKNIDKFDKIRILVKYQNNNRFGELLKKELGIKYTEPQLNKKSVEDLELILHRIRTHLNTRNMDQVFDHMVRYTASGYEELVSGLGYDIDGFSELLLHNPAFWDAFERWKIEQKIPNIPPSMQLMYIVASTTYIAHLKSQHKNDYNNKNIDIPPQKLKSKKKNKDLIIIDEK
jgi:hypothetical protein